MVEEEYWAPSLNDTTEELIEDELVWDIYQKDNFDKLSMFYNLIICQLWFKFFIFNHLKLFQSL